MTSRKIRENTFRIDFSNIPKKPSFKEVHSFVARELGLSRENVQRIQISHVYACAFVQTVDAATAEQIVKHHDNKHEYECNKKKYRLRIFMEDGCTQVKLHDLSSDVSDEQITQHMAQYGDVVSIHELVWSDDYEFSGLFTGIRLVRMVLKQQVKSYINIGGECTYVTYSGQRATCRHCGEYIHTGIPCIQNKKLLAQKASVNERLSSAKPSSYSDAVRNAPPRSASTNSNTDRVERQSTKNLSGREQMSATFVDVSKTKPAEKTNPQNDISPFESRESSSSSQKTSQQLLRSNEQSQMMDISPDSELPQFRVPILPAAAEKTIGKHKRDDDSGTDGSSVSQTRESRPRTRKTQPKALRSEEQ